MPEPSHIIIFTTANSQDEAAAIARLLVKEKAAACVSISAPIHSIYRWQGKITTDREWMLMIKTTAAAYGAVEKIIRENHSYTVPEILAIPVYAGAEPYLRWIRENTHQP